MLNSVQKHLKSLIKAPLKKLLISYSHGPDSRFLLELLISIYPPNIITLVYFNHELRDDVDAEIKEIKALSNVLKCKLTIKKLPIKSYSKKHKISIENSGHILRKYFLLRLAKNHHFTTIFTGHHFDDHIESIILQLSQGSKFPMGIQETKLENDIIFIRPLLHLKKKEILSYLKEKNISYSIDISNEDINYDRNLIRRNLNNLKDKDSLFDTLIKFNNKTKVIFNQIKTEYNYKKEMIYSDLLLKFKETPYILNQFILGYLKHFNNHNFNVSLTKNKLPTAPIRFNKNQINSIAKAILVEESLKIDLKKNYYLEVLNDTLSIKSRFKEKEAPHYSYKFKINNSDYIENLKITIKTKIILSNKNYASNETTAYINADQLKSDIIEVRNRRNGDYFLPFGMTKKKKLKNYFIDKKIPKNIRERLPLIKIGEDIVWIPSYQIDNRYKITKETKRMLKIEVYS